MNAPQGARGGHSGPPAATFRRKADGVEERLPGVVECRLEVGEQIRGIDAGGGGYGDPITRDPERVLRDVLERWETIERANKLYGVVFSGSVEDESLAVDVHATVRQRASIAAG